MKKETLTLVFGGTFDPCHKEHLRMANAAMKETKADRLVICPTYKQEYKDKSQLPFSKRVQLLKILFKDAKYKVKIDNIEKKRADQNFSVYVLKELEEKYGKIVFLIGSDSFLNIRKWVHFADLVKSYKIAVVEREGYKVSSSDINMFNRKYNANVKLLKFKGREVSSTAIKSALYLQSNTPWLTKPQKDYLKETGLFNKYADKIRQLKKLQSKDLFAHTKAVVTTCLDLRSRYNFDVPYESVFLAALLHDCAKQVTNYTKYKIKVDITFPKVAHQYAGAALAKKLFKVLKKDVLNAIECHTTAKADMNTLEKIVYLGDSVSYDREYEPIPKLREIAFKNFDQGFIEVLKYTYNKHINTAMHKNTEEAYNYYIYGKDILDVIRLRKFICHELEMNKAEDITVIDVAGRTNIADYFVLATSLGDKHTNALADIIEKRVKDEYGLYAINGISNQKNWLVLDYNGVMVHIFNDETRKEYDLEEMWAKNCNSIRKIHVE